MRNNNQAIVRKIAIAGLKHNKLLTRFTVAAILLATVLITTVLLTVSSIATVNANHANAITGSWHAMVSGVSQEQYLHMKQDGMVERIGLTVPVGTSKNGGAQLNISYSDADALTLNALSVSDGKMPEQENEILIEKDYLDSVGLSSGIGERISLAVADINGGAPVEMEFIISGYLNTSASGTNRTLYGAMVSENYFEARGGWTAFVPTVLFRIGIASSLDATELAGVGKMITESAGLDRPPAMNEAYIAIAKPSLLLIAVAAAVVGIIIFAGILVISCIFHIAILNAIREYGQLRTIGMTAKQIKKLIFWQGSFLSIFAIPVGLLLGAFVSYAWVPQGFSSDALLWALPLSAALIYSSVWFSIKKPAKAASRVSPIEASRYIGLDTDAKGANASITKVGSPIALAKKQLGRYKKKNLSAVISIAFAGILLCSLSTLLSSLNARDMSLQGFPDGQFILGISNAELMKNPLERVQANNPLTDSLRSDLAAVSGFEKITERHNLPASKDTQSAESDIWMVGFDESHMPKIAEYAAFLETDSYQAMSETNSIIIGQPNSFLDRFGFRAEPGQTVSLKVYDGTSSRIVDFTIAGIMDESKVGPYNANMFDTVMLPIETIKRLVSVNTVRQYTVQVSEKLESQAETEIEQLLQDRAGVQLRSLSAAVAENENFMQALKWSVWLAVLFIGCFAIMNLANTIITGVAARQNEFALLRSVGMTQKQLYAMVRYENLTVAVLALLLSITVGGGIGAVLYAQLKSGIMSYLHYQFPVLSVTVYCVIVILCTLVIGTLALKRQNKSSLIEQLRNLEG